MALFRPLKLETAFFEPQALGIALYIRDRLGLDASEGDADVDPRRSGRS